MLEINWLMSTYPSESSERLTVSGLCLRISDRNLERLVSCFCVRGCVIGGICFCGFSHCLYPPVVVFLVTFD